MVHMVRVAPGAWRALILQDSFSMRSAIHGITAASIGTGCMRQVVTQ